MTLFITTLNTMSYPEMFGLVFGAAAGVTAVFAIVMYLCGMRFDFRDK